jgi:hypothetical protein
MDRNLELRQARDSAADATSQARTLLRFGRTGVLDMLNVEASLATTETALAASDAAGERVPRAGRRLGILKPLQFRLSARNH